jgi:hypothetical protein
VNHLHWVPHALTDLPRYQQARISGLLLSWFESMKQSPDHCLVVLDESWLYLCTGREKIWLQPDERPLRDRGISSGTKKRLSLLHAVCLGSRLSMGFQKDRNSMQETASNIVVYPFSNPVLVQAETSSSFTMTMQGAQDQKVLRVSATK